jgi:rRNA maturation endonuclease Nob1
VVEVVLERTELVRCLACRRVYEQHPPADGQHDSACPHCGDLAWLALQVPVDKTSAPATA